MKKYLLSTGFAALIVLSACGTNGDNNDTAGDDPTDAQEEIDEDNQEEQASDTETNDEDQADDGTEEDTTDSTESPTSDDGTVEDPEETDETFYSLDELEPVFYVGMDYGTYYEELQAFPIDKTIQNEEEGQYLDLFPANDGYLGVLSSEEEGIINIHRFQSLDEADGYFD
ncbi:hypothetical protein [Alkalicoccobacillus porphyridii]|uniref:Uncharacterized protein n=1 Tax=Alkalicoccobacillus porphyridii TaxID=2597270 RepID=A0A553ZTY3_9BACI|nr:hypothetical protein [Alkalicoccobacillus porphyridii]TSB44914.1 hypothetical protein FN960_18880 [Alkalicoccobacillus porphyridii]